MKNLPTPEEPEELSKRLCATLQQAQVVVKAIDSSLEASVRKVSHYLKQQADRVVPAAEGETLSLALVGKFQSGKSTLYNYLCGGRELSPVGPKGGGIPTSAGRVTAHPLPKGAREYAKIIWRTPNELVEIIAKGKDTAPTAEQMMKVRSLLSSRNKRARLEEELLRRLRTDASEKNTEALQSALLALHFFPEYQKEIRKERPEYTLEEAYQCSSYPQDWQKLWQDLLGNIADVEEYFTRKNVTFKKIAFVFCAEIHMYVNSAYLRDLGVSIIDCPGYGSTYERDKNIAHECIRSADIVLYLMDGKSQLDTSDIKMLKYIRMEEGKPLIFACNLHESEMQWDRIKKSEDSRFQLSGFGKIKIEDFHAAMALRAQQLHMALNDQLPPMSARAILGGKEGDVVTKLRKKLEDNLDCLKGDNDTEGEHNTHYYLQESKVNSLLKAIYRKAQAIRSLRTVYPYLGEIQRKLQEEENQLTSIAANNARINSAEKKLKEIAESLVSEGNWRNKVFEDVRNRVCVSCALTIGDINRYIASYKPKWSLFRSTPPPSQRMYEYHIRMLVGQTGQLIVKALTSSSALSEMRKYCEEKYNEIKQLEYIMPDDNKPMMRDFPKNMIDSWAEPDTSKFGKNKVLSFDANEIISEMKNFLLRWVMTWLDTTPTGPGPLKKLEEELVYYQRMLVDMAKRLRYHRHEQGEKLRKKREKGMDVQKLRELSDEIHSFLASIT